MNAPQALSISDAIGTPFGGGFYAGRYLEGDQLCMLIVSPKIGDLAPRIWNKSLKLVEGARSYFDGLANTLAMAEAGSTLARDILALDIGGETDWFLPARDQLELLYRNFKPGSRENYVYRNGDNPSSMPPGYPYTEELPAPTQIAGFAAGGAEAFEESWYWSSTQLSGASGSGFAWSQSFSNGSQNIYHKYGELRARAVRRLKI